MNFRTRSGALAVVLAGLCVFSCKLVNDDTGGATVTSKDFRLTNEVSPWTEASTDGYRYYDPQGLFGPIDGGAPQYNDNGLVDGILQNLTSPPDRTNRVFVMDFGTPEKAAAMCDIKRSDAPNPKPVGSYPQSTAYGKETLAGMQVFAHLGKFYFEMDIAGTGYEDKTLVGNDAAMFLQVYETKIQ